MTAPAPSSAEDAAAFVAAHRAAQDAALRDLYALLDRFSVMPRATIARPLNLTDTRIHDIAESGHEFRQLPPGRHVLRLCRADAACREVHAEGGNDRRPF